MRLSLLTFAVIAAAALTCLSGSTSASIFSWDISPGANDIVQIKLDNWEPDLNTVVSGGLLFGIGRITEITSLLSGDVLWEADADSELTFVFSDFVLASITPSGGPPVVGDTLNFTGGIASLYFDDTPDTTAANVGKTEGTNAAPDALGTFTNGTKVADLLGHNDSATGFSLQTDLNGLSPFDADGVGLFDVVPGSGVLASTFNSNAFTDGSDMEFRTTLSPALGAGGTDYPIRSNDPIIAQVVPEPVSLIAWTMLIGLGLLSGRRARS
jgi:hypothetical protein